MCLKIKRMDGEGDGKFGTFPLNRRSRRWGPSTFPFPRVRRVGNGTAPTPTAAQATAPTLPGTFFPCEKWYLVSAADHVTGCQGIMKKYNISLEFLRSLNGDINTGCTNLRIGYRYCAARKHFLLDRGEVEGKAG